MPVQPQVKVSGLHTADNQLGVPPGSLVLAEHCVHYFRDVLESRRGQPFLAAGLGVFGGGNSRLIAGAFFQGSLIGLYGTNGNAPYTLTQNPGSGFSDFTGTYSPVDSALERIHFQEAQKNLYLNTSTGLFLLDSLLNQPQKAGVPKGIDGSAFHANLAGAPGSGWLAPNNQVAYRVEYGIKDANLNIKLGSPSGRLIAVNPADVVVPIGGLTRTGGTLVTATAPNGFPSGLQVTLSPGEGNFAAGTYTLTGVASLSSFQYTNAGANASSVASETFSSGLKNVSLFVLLPPTVTTSHFIRIYRSFESGGANIPPSDEMFLAYEAQLTAGQIAAGAFSITDTTPSAFLGDALDTNANTGNGPLQAHERPPLAKDVCYFDDRLFLFNAASRNRFFLNLLGVNTGTGGTGLSDGDTITIAGITYTAKNAPAGTVQFQLYSNGTPAQNIEWTSRALLEMVNNPANASPVSGFYVSGAEGGNPGQDPPGKLMFEEVNIGGAAFSVYSSNTGAWFPALTTSSSGAQVSNNTRLPNAAYFSLQGQPEAVPITNWLPIGAPNKQVLRGRPLRDKVFCFCEDRKIFTISGKGSYRVDIFDESTQLTCPDTLVEHSNRLFALTDQGVVAVSDAGVQIVSKDIEDQILPLLAMMKANGQTAIPYGVSYESDRQYLLFVPTVPADTQPTQVFVYNSLQQTWDHWPLSRTWALCNPTTDILFLADNSSQVRAEKKAYAPTDYEDESVTIGFTSVSGNVVFAPNTGGAVVGDLCYQDETHNSVITAVNTNVSVTVVNGAAFSATPTQIRKAIPCVVKFSPYTGGAPGLMKHFRDLVLFFKQLLVSNVLTVTVDTEKAAELPITSQLSAEGLGAGQGNGAAVVRRGVLVQHQQATQLRPGMKLQEARCRWQLQGYSVTSEGGSERMSGGATNS